MYFAITLFIIFKFNVSLAIIIDWQRKAKLQL